MDKYVLDYGEFSPFKGLRIYSDYLNEGLEFAKSKKINDIAIWSGDDEKRQTIDFNFLEEFHYLKTFHCNVPLTKKSRIEGLYYLNSLKELRWGVSNFFNLNFSKLMSLQRINIDYSDSYKGWENLPNLKRLMIGGVKTEDLSFLQETTNLEYLRIIKGSFTSIIGIENCKSLKTLFLQSCNSLTELNKTLKQLPSLEQLNLERCKKVNVEQELVGVDIKNISII